jgi:predicted DNA-binding transcriptional regulator AlpA
VISKYLDARELAEELQVSHATVMRRLKREPWRLPPIAHVGIPRLLRWRENDVWRWRLETELKSELSHPASSAIGDVNASG